MYKITLMHKSAIALLVILLGVFFYAWGYAQDALQIVGLTNKVALVNEELSFKIEVDSPNKNNLSYYYKDSLPKGVKFNRADGSFYWKPASTQVGVHKITLGVARGQEKKEKAIDVTVINKDEVVLSDKAIGPYSLNVFQDKAVWTGYREDKTPVVYTYDLFKNEPPAELDSGDYPTIYKDKLLYVKDGFLYDDTQKKICGPVSVSGTLARYEKKLVWSDDNKAYYYDTAWHIKSKISEFNLAGMRVRNLSIYNEKIVLIGADKDIDNIYLYNTAKLSQPENITNNISLDIHFGSVALYKDKIIWTQNSGDDSSIYIYDMLTHKSEVFAINVLADIYISEDYLIWQSISGKSPEEVNSLHVYDFINEREVVLSLEPGVIFNPKAVVSKDRIIYASECKLDCPRDVSPYKLALVNLYFKPQITNVEPQFGIVPNSEIMLKGSGFGDKAGSVLIGGIAADILEWTSTKIRCTVPEKSKAGDSEIKVVSLSGESQPKKIYIYLEWKGTKSSTGYNRSKAAKAMSMAAAAEGEDNTPPVSTLTVTPVILPPPAEYNTDITVQISASDPETGVRGIGFVYYAGNPANPLWSWSPSDTIQFALNTDGDYIIKYYAVNNASQVEDPKHEKHIKINKAALLVSGAITIAALDGNTERTNLTTVNLNITGNNIAQMRFSNYAADFSRPESVWKPYSPTESNWTLTSGDGDKIVYAQFKNNLGNTAEANDVIILDQTAPTTTFKINNDLAVTSSLTVKLNMHDEVASLMRFSNTGEFSAPGSPELPAWESYLTEKVGWRLLDTGIDGERIVYAQFKDQAGNPSIPVSDTIIYDSTGPTTGSLIINDGNPYTKDINVKLNISGTDITKIRFSKDSDGFTDLNNPSWLDYVNAAKEYPWQLLPGDGLKTVYAQLKDQSGNTSIISGAITLDTTAPTVTKFQIVGNNSSNKEITNSPQVKLDYAISDTGSGIADMQFSESNEFGLMWITCSGSGPNNGPGSGPTNGSDSYPWSLISADGPVTVSAHFRDVVGNVRTVSDTINLRMSGPATTFTLDIDSGYPTRSGNEWHNKDDRKAVFSLSAKDNSGSGIDKIFYSTDGSDVLGFSGVGELCVVDLFTDGVYTVKYRALDKAGHYEDIRTAPRLVKIDKTPPQTVADYDGADGRWKQVGFIVNLSAVDQAPAGLGADKISGLKEIRYSISKDGGAFVPPVSGSPPNVVFSEQGIYKLKFKAVDNALNEETERVIQQIKVSTTGEEPNAAPVAKDFTVNVNEDEITTFNFDVTDANNDRLTIGIHTPPQYYKTWFGHQPDFPLKTTYQAVDNYNGADSIEYEAYDGRGGASGKARVTINVISVNDLPVLRSIGNKTGKVGELLTFTVSAQDVENDTLSYSAEYEFIPGEPLVPVSELGATINSRTGEFSWTPRLGQVYTNLPVTFRVNDGKGGSDSETIKITIEANKPTGSVTLAKSAANPLGELQVSLDISGSSRGITDWEAFIFKKNANGVTTLKTKKEHLATPLRTVQRSYTETGLTLEFDAVYYCAVLINDANGMTANITSNQIAISNSPPNLNNIPLQLIKNEGERIEIGEIQKATDPEGQNLEYIYSEWFNSTLPYTIGYDTATVTNTPVDKFIHVKVTDSMRLSDERDVRVIVNNVVKPPEFNPSSVVLNKLEGDSVDYLLPMPRFYGTALSVVLRGSLPSGLLRQTAANGSDHIVGTIAQGTAGRYVAEWVVEDTEGPSVFTITINVTRTNHPPVATGQVLNIANNVNTPITLSATDSDGDRLTYRILDPKPTYSGVSEIYEGNKVVFMPYPTTYYTGESFYFQANDGKADSNVAAVTVNMRPPDAQPPESPQIPHVTNLRAESIRCHNIPGGLTDSIQVNWIPSTSISDKIQYILQRKWQPNDQWPHNVPGCSYANNDPGWCGVGISSGGTYNGYYAIDNYVSPGRAYYYRVAAVKYYRDVTFAGQIVPVKYLGAVSDEIGPVYLNSSDACKGKEWTDFGNKAKSKVETVQTKSLVSQFMPGQEKSGLSFAPKADLTEEIISSVVRPAGTKAEKPAIIQFRPVAQPQKTTLRQESEGVKASDPSFVAAYNDNGSLKEISVINKEITHNYAVAQDNRKPIITLSRDDKSKAYLHLDKNRQKVESIKVKAATGVSEEKMQEEVRGVASFMGYELPALDKKQK